MKDTLDTFCELSGQKVSLAKSKVYFSPNIGHEQRDEMCEVLGMRSTPNLGNYLGFPLKLPGASSQDFDFVIDRVQAKLQGWKASFLSMAGRVLLTQSVTSAILAYVMQGCVLPSRVLNCLDRLNHDFIWGSSMEKKKMHLISWEKITKPKNRGGLGIQSAKGRNLTMAAKLCWRMETARNARWAKVLKKKYRSRAHKKKWELLVCLESYLQRKASL